MKAIIMQQVPVKEQVSYELFKKNRPIINVTFYEV